MKKVLLLLIVSVIIFLSKISAQEVGFQLLPRVEIWQKYEVIIENEKVYNDPFRDVELNVQLKHQSGRMLKQLLKFFSRMEG